MLNISNKSKIAKLVSIETPAGYLAPKGRATQQIHVEEAHSCGEFLASTNSEIICKPPVGEVGSALVTGALAMGGKVTVYQDKSDGEGAVPEGANVKQSQRDCTNEVLGSIGHMWLMPPALADLERYLETWIGSGFRPLVCLSPRDEFLLLRGFVQDIVSVGSPEIAERLIFARTPEEGWEKLSELLA